MRFRGSRLDPVRQIVGIGVAGIQEAASFHHQLHGVDRRTPGVPSERTGACRLGMHADRLGDLPALLDFRHVLVLDPFQAVAGDIPAGLLHGRDHLGIALQCGGDAEHRGRQFAFAEYPPQPPEAGARTIFEHRLDVGVALARPGLRAQHVGQERLRGAVAVQNVVLAALFEIHHELHGDARVARPFRIGRAAAVAAEIARVTGLCHLDFLEADFLRALPQHGLAERGQVFQPRGQGDEMIAGELAHLAGEVHAAIGEQDLGLADAAGIEDDLAGRSGRGSPGFRTAWLCETPRRSWAPAVLRNGPGR